MSNLAQATDSRIENYLSRLATALGGTPFEEKQDILCEIRAHLVDSMAAIRGGDAAAERVMRLLGTPEELAERYRAEGMFTQASDSLSPWLLLRTSWHWARLGIKGMLAFFLALIGYGTALTFTFTVLMKLSKRPNWGCGGGTMTWLSDLPRIPMACTSCSGSGLRPQ